MTKLTNINEFLPDDLSEETVEKIFSLVDATINEQVEEKVRLLEARVSAYLRNKIDELKEQALVELSEENEVFRNAQLFESIRAFMGLELGKEDEETVVHGVNKEYESLKEEFDTLLEQVEVLVEANDELESNLAVAAQKVKTLSEGVESLTEANQQLEGQVEELESAITEDFKSSEKAVVVTKADSEPLDENLVHPKNELITDEVLRFMPKN